MLFVNKTLLEYAMQKIKKIISKIGLKTDQVSKNLLILGTLCMLSTLGVMLFSVFLLQNMLEDNYIDQKTRQERFSFWMERVEEYPNSPDILYNAAIAALDIEKRETALKLVNKSIVLDPLFTKATVLQLEIVSDIR